MIAVILSTGCTTRPSNSGGKPNVPEIVVEYNRTGGIAGFQDHMVVFGNGQVVYSRKEGAGTFTIPNDSVQSIRDILDNADFPALAPHYPAPNPGADYFFYSITYQGKTITTETGGIPPSLLPIVNRLDTLLTDQA